MNKLITIAALVAIAAPSAFASKARVEALGSTQGAPNDIQNIFAYPSRVNDFGNAATVEFGSSSKDTTGTAANKSAEGGFFRNMGDSVFGIYFGRKSAVYPQLKTLLGTPTVGTTQLTTDGQNNPFELFYGMKMGDVTYGASLTYSNYEDKVFVANKLNKESLLGLRLGAATGDLDVGLLAGLSSAADFYGATAASSVQKYKGKTGLALNVTYTVMSDLLVHGSYGMDGAKFDTGVTGATETEAEATSMKLGVESNVKGDGHAFYYGAYYTSTVGKNKTADFKQETSKLPVYMALEADATSWLVLRASMEQSVLVASAKTATAGTSTAETTGANDATVAAGLGLRFNKLTMDASLTGANSTGKFLDFTTEVGTKASLTYMF